MANEVEIVITVNDDDAKAALAGLKEDAESAGGEITVGADTEEATASLDGLRAQLDELESTFADLTVGVDDVEASATLSALNAEIDQLEATAADIFVHADTSDAEAKLGALQAQVAELDAEQVTIGGSVGGGDTAEDVALLSANIADLQAYMAELQTASDSTGASIDDLGTAFAGMSDVVAGAGARLDSADAEIAAMGAETAAGADAAAESLGSLDNAMIEASGAAEGAGLTLSGLGSKIGELANYIIPALIGAFVGLSPVLLTVGSGLGLFGIAAYEVLTKSQAAAAEVDGLKSSFDSLEGDLSPEILSGFTDAIGVVAELLGELSPVAQAAGGALDQVLQQVNSGINGAEWQSFFGWMEANVGPDIQILAGAFGQFAASIPPAVEALQPLARELITTGGAAATAVEDISKLTDSTEGLDRQASSSTGIWKDLWGAVVRTFDQMEPGATAVNQLKNALNNESGSASTAKGTTDGLGNSMATAVPKVQSVTDQIDDLYDALNKITDPANTAINDAVQFASDQAQLASDLQASNGQLGINTAAQRASSSAMTQAASDALILSENIYQQTGSVQQAVQPLQALVGQLQASGDKSGYAQQEIVILEAAIAKLESKQITITVEGQLLGSQQAIDIAQGLGSSGSSVSEAVAVLSHAAGGVVGAASGMVSAGVTMVGEQGPELVSLPTGSTVMSNPDTMSMLGGLGGVQQIQLSVDSSGNGAFEQFMVTAIRNWVRVKGGGIVQMAFGRNG